MKTFRMNPKSLRFKRHYFPIDGIYIISITDCHKISSLIFLRVDIFRNDGVLENRHKKTCSGGSRFFFFIFYPLVFYNFRNN